MLDQTSLLPKPRADHRCWILCFAEKSESLQDKPLFFIFTHLLDRYVAFTTRCQLLLIHVIEYGVFHAD